MSKVTNDDIISYLTDICDNMVKNGYDFLQDASKIRVCVKETFTEQYKDVKIPPPKLIPLISKTVSTYINKAKEQSQEQEQELESKQPLKRKQQKTIISVDDLVENVKKHAG